jgi:hypothetical protein
VADHERTGENLLPKIVAPRSGSKYIQLRNRIVAGPYTWRLYPEVLPTPPSGSTKGEAIQRFYEKPPRLTDRLTSDETVNELKEIQDLLVKRVSNVIDDETERLRISELCGERPDTVIGTTHDVSALSESFKDAVKLADRQYAGELLDAEMFSSGEAMGRVRQVPACERATVIQQELDRWRDRSVEAIRGWAPKYFTIARSFPQQISQVPSQWTKAKLLEGVTRRLKPDQLRAVTFWLKAACGERDIEPVESPTPWRMPAWGVTQQPALAEVIKAATETVQLPGSGASHLTMAECPESEISADSSVNRARVVGRVINELLQIRPQMKSDSDYEKIEATFPEFVAFKVCNTNPELKMKLENIQGHQQFVRFAIEIVAAKYGRKYNTVEKDWRTHKRKRPKCTVLLSVHESVKWTLRREWSRCSRGATPRCD